MAQIKLFVFAGHDTTSAAAIFTYHLLAQHPDTLSEVRAEYDEVFGSEISVTASLLSSKRPLLNQLSYTLAVIKESLRICPTVAALRDGQPDFFISGDNGQRFPTCRCIVWAIITARITIRATGHDRRSSSLVVGSYPRATNYTHPRTHGALSSETRAAVWGKSWR